MHEGVGRLLDLFLRDGVVLVIDLVGRQDDAVGHAPLAIALGDADRLLDDLCAVIERSLLNEELAFVGRAFDQADEVHLQS